jgi:hypothetical protein
MKRIVWMVVLALALPVAAFANSVDFGNLGGTLAGGSSGLSLTNSMLQSINGLGGGGLVQGDLGSVSFSTGILSSGNLQNGGTFKAGGSFVISGNGSSKGVPNSVIFKGTFTGPVTWTLVTLANGTHHYTLTGALSGTWINGAKVFGATVQISINTGKGFFNGSTSISSGDTNITAPAVPEPGTLGLFGTGLVGLAGALHRKFKA